MPEPLIASVSAFVDRVLMYSRDGQTWLAQNPSPSKIVTGLQRVEREEGHG